MRGGTLRVALASDITSLDPWTANDADTLAVLGQVYEPLVEREPGGFGIVPRLAARWTVSSDARIWTFTLRTGIQFHDGTRFDASAVVFNFGRARAFARFDLDSLLDSVVASDAYTVVFTLRTPFAPFLATLASPAFGLVSPACVRQGPSWATPGTRCAAGTGPFTIGVGGWRMGDRIALTRNASYWGSDADGRRLPYLDGITFLPVRDESVRVGALKAAQVDLALDLGPSSSRGLGADPNIATAASDPYATTFLGLGQTAKPFDRVDVRRALALAIDRGAIVQGAYAGDARPATQLVPPGLLGFDDTVTQFSPADTAGAKKILADAGYATGLSTDLWYSPEAASGLPDPKRVADSIAADLSKIGVNATVRTEDATAFAADARAGRLPLWLGVRGPDRADPDDFFADATQDPFALELLRRARGEVDTSKRAELYKQVTKLVQQTVSRIPLVWARRLAGASRRVHGFPPQPVGPDPLAIAWLGS